MSCAQFYYAVGTVRQSKTFIQSYSCLFYRKRLNWFKRGFQTDESNDYQFQAIVSDDLPKGSSGVIFI